MKEAKQAIECVSVPEDSKLTPIHWELYRLIEARTKGNELSVPQREIYDLLKSKGYEVSWNESQNQHNDHCRWLWDLIWGEDGINFSPEVDHIIVHDSEYNYRFGSANEVLARWAYYYDKTEKSKKRHYSLLHKIKQDGQGKLLSNQGNPIDDDSLAKLFHETFNRIKQEGSTNGTTAE